MDRIIIQTLKKVTKVIVWVILFITGYQRILKMLEWHSSGFAEKLHK